MSARFLIPILLANLLLIPTPALAVRGIEAPSVDDYVRPCSKALDVGKPITLTLVYDQEIKGRVSYVDETGLGLLRREGSVTYFDRDLIASIRMPRPRFPRGTSFGGLGIGMAAGFVTYVLVEGFDRYGHFEWPGRSLDGAFFIMSGGALGFTIGTAVPLISPGEDEIECAW